MKKIILVLFIQVFLCTISKAQYNVLSNNGDAIEIKHNSFKVLRNSFPANNYGIGVGSLQELNAGSTIRDNFAFGGNTLNKMQNGQSNIAIGGLSLSNAMAGNRNVSIGFGAMVNNNGSSNLAIGYLSGAFAPSTSYKVSIGYAAAAYDSSASLSIGAYAGVVSAFPTVNSKNIFIGAFTGYEHNDSHSNIAIGAKSMEKGEDATNNTIIGAETLMHPSLLSTSNVVVGYQAMQLDEMPNNITNRAVAIGYQTIHKDTNSVSPIAIGYRAMERSKNTLNSVAVGHEALRFLAKGGGNTGIGYQVGGYNIFFFGGGSVEFGLSDANDCTLVGYRSGQSLTNKATNHTAIGARSIYNAQSNTKDITAIGYNSGSGNTNGNYNTFIGAETKVASGGLANVTAIGFEAEATSSNMVALGNTAVTSIGGYASFTNFSDRRLKKNIFYHKQLGYDFINQLKPSRYHYTANPESFLLDGFIAQDVNHILDTDNHKFSGLIQLKDENNTLQLAYESFTLPLINSTQELDTRIEKLLINKKSSPNLDSYFAKLK